MNQVNQTTTTSAQEQTTPQPTKREKKSREPRGIDFTGEIPITGLVLTTSLGNKSLIPGNEFRNGMSTGGIIEKMTLLPNGAIRVDVRAGAQNPGSAHKYPVRHLLVWPNGSHAEVGQ